MERKMSERLCTERHRLQNTSESMMVTKGKDRTRYNSSSEVKPQRRVELAELSGLFSDLKSDFTFSPRSPISPCWEKKQSIKGGEAEGGVWVQPLGSDCIWGFIHAGLWRVLCWGLLRLRTDPQVSAYWSSLKRRKKSAELQTNESIKVKPKMQLFTVRWKRRKPQDNWWINAYYTYINVCHSANINKKMLHKI